MSLVLSARKIEQTDRIPFPTLRTGTSSVFFIVFLGIISALSDDDGKENTRGEEEISEKMLKEVTAVKAVNTQYVRFAAEVLETLWLTCFASNLLQWHFRIRNDDIFSISTSSNTSSLNEKRNRYC